MLRTVSPNNGEFSRRLFLGGALGLALAAAGCSREPAPEAPGEPATLASRTATIPFYIAHRGGGDNWPEMTAYAYEQAAALPGLQAIEISVCLTKDDVLVCSHDATTERVTGVDYTISEQPWSALESLMVTSAFTVDPTQPARPFTRFDDVISKYIDRLVVFVEPKTPQAVEPLMAAMVALGEPSRTVWKQPINQPNFSKAKSHGFTTWGYVLNERGHLGDRLKMFAADRNIDALGAQRSQPDALIKQVVAAAKENDKKTIMWNIRSAEDRARALGLGCEGMMTSNIAQVPAIPLSGAADTPK